MDTFGLLKDGFILAWDDDSGIVVTWDAVCIYTIWVGDGREWDKVDTRTVDPTFGGHPVSLSEAADIANNVLTNVIRGE